MPQVRFIAIGPYLPGPGERLLLLQNSGDRTPLYIGIRNGEYMIAQPMGTSQPTYVLTEEQWVRMQQQLAAQPAYVSWVQSGLLTLVEQASVPEPPPPPPPEDELEAVEEEASP